MDIFYCNNITRFIENFTSKNAHFLLDSNSSSIPFVLETTTKLTTYAMLPVLVLGLVGNIFILILFSQKEMSSSLNHVYLRCLALFDSIFLVVYFQRTFLNNHPQLGSNKLTCQAFSYLLFLMRFVSSYVCVSFSIQRLFTIYMPLSARFKSKASAWNLVLTVVWLGVIVNLWVPFVIDKSLNTCDVDIEYKTEYYHANFSFEIITVFVPIVLICLMNSLIIYKLVKDETKLKHKRKTSTDARTRHLISSDLTSLGAVNRMSFEIKPHYLPFDHLLKKKTKNSLNYSKKITVLMLLLSYSYVIFHLPYLLTWSFYYIEINLWPFSLTLAIHYQYFCFIKISEVFYVLNFGIKFYVYFACCTLFGSQYKYSSINMNFFCIFLRKMLFIWC